MGEIYEVVVFTASLSKYADPVLDQLDVHRVVKHRLFRESCYNNKGNYVKVRSRFFAVVARAFSSSSLTPALFPFAGPVAARPPDIREHHHRQLAGELRLPPEQRRPDQQLVQRPVRPRPRRPSSSRAALTPCLSPAQPRHRVDRPRAVPRRPVNGRRRAQRARRQPVPRADGLGRAHGRRLPAALDARSPSSLEHTLALRPIAVSRLDPQQHRPSPHSPFALRPSSFALMRYPPSLSRRRSYHLSSFLSSSRTPASPSLPGIVPPARPAEPPSLPFLVVIPVQPSFLPSRAPQMPRSRVPTLLLALVPPSRPSVVVSPFLVLFVSFPLLVRDCNRYKVLRSLFACTSESIDSKEKHSQGPQVQR